MGSRSSLRSSGATEIAFSTLHGVRRVSAKGPQESWCPDRTTGLPAYGSKSFEMRKKIRIKRRGRRRGLNRIASRPLERDKGNLSPSSESAGVDRQAKVEMSAKPTIRNLRISFFHRSERQT